jgi:diacylglycerol kinase family enzyme
VSVRAKFKVDTVSPAGADGTVSEVKLSAVIGGSPENDKFFKWTPSGSITIGTVNVEAAKQFEPGAEFYVDFTPVT